MIHPNRIKENLLNIYSSRFKKLTLREKTLLFFGFTLSALIGVSYITSSVILFNSLNKAEKQSVQQTLQGVVSVLSKEQEAFTSRYSDWSAWDDTYTFIQDRNSAYIKSNQVPGALTNLKINLSIFINSQNQTVYGSKFDFKTKQIQLLPADFFNKYIDPKNQLLELVNKKGNLTGIILLPDGPMLITCQPILTSEGKGPARGILIFGRYLDNNWVDNLSKITRLPLKIHSFKESHLPNDFIIARRAITNKKPYFVQALNEQLIAGHVLIKDIYNQPALILRVDIARQIYQQGKVSHRHLSTQLIILGLGFGGVSLIMLERMVLARLAQLSIGVTQIRESNNLSLRLSIFGTDEITNLTTNINEMLETLEKSQNDVRNAFNQLTKTNKELQTVVEQLQSEIVERQQVEIALRSSEDTLKKQTQQLELTLSELQQAQLQLVQSEKMSSLGQLVAGIAHEINNPVNFIHGNINYARNYTEDLLALLKLYQAQLVDPTPEILHKVEEIDLEFLIQDFPNILNSMQVGADRICEIVQALRIFSRLDESEVKNVDIHEGIDSTLMILQSRLKAKSDYPGIKVIKVYGQLPKIECYAGQLNQVFMNIISNAIDALEERDRDRSLAEMKQNPSTIRIQTEATENELVRIRIADNGLGMSQQVQARLFDPFFTTKPVGKGTGMGLSISYQIVTAKHGGSLQCCSSPGQGAEFVIDIPVKSLKGNEEQGSGGVGE